MLNKHLLTLSASSYSSLCNLCLVILKFGFLQFCLVLCIRCYFVMHSLISCSEWDQPPKNMRPPGSVPIKVMIIDL